MIINPRSRGDHIGILGVKLKQWEHNVRSFTIGLFRVREPFIVEVPCISCGWGIVRIQVLVVGCPGRI